MILNQIEFESDSTRCAPQWKETKLNQVLDKSLDSQVVHSGVHLPKLTSDVANLPYHNLLLTSLTNVATTES